MNRISYLNLPREVSSSINEDLFLTAYKSPLTENYCVWVVDRANNCQIEREFDSISFAELSQEDRASILPPERRISSDGNAFYAVLRHFLDATTRAQCIEFSIFGEPGGEFIAAFTEMARFGIDPHKHFKGAERMLDYKSYSSSEKAGYWAAQIYRQMRWNGESGLEEMSVLTPSLIDEIREKEKDIEELLPQIISLLAKYCVQDEKVFSSVAMSKIGISKSAHSVKKKKPFFKFWV